MLCTAETVVFYELVTSIRFMSRFGILFLAKSPLPADGTAVGLCSDDDMQIQQSWCASGVPLSPLAMTNGLFHIILDI